MKTATDWIALAALAISVINLGIFVFSHGLHIKVSNVKIIPLDRAQLLFIDCIISNLSALPFSIYNAEIVYDGFLLANRKEDLFAYPLKEQPQIQRIQVSTDIPIQINAYTSQRIVLEYDLWRHHKRFLKSLRGNQANKPYIRLYTSRGRRKSRLRNVALDSEKWFRKYSLMFASQESLSK